MYVYILEDAQCMLSSSLLPACPPVSGYFILLDSDTVSLCWIQTNCRHQVDALPAGTPKKIKTKKHGSQNAGSKNGVEMTLILLGWAGADVGNDHSSWD